MVVAAENNRSRDFATGYGFVECKCDFCTTFGVGVEYTGLRTDNKVISSGLFNPVDIVVELTFDVFRCCPAYIFKHFSGEAVGNGKIFRLARSNNPTERAKSVVEEQRAHNILNIRRIAECTIGIHDIRTSS